MIEYKLNEEGILVQVNNEQEIDKIAVDVANSLEDMNIQGISEDIREKENFKEEIKEENLVEFQIGENLEQTLDIHNDVDKIGEEITLNNEIENTQNEFFEEISKEQSVAKLGLWGRIKNFFGNKLKFTIELTPREEEIFGQVKDFWTTDLRDIFKK